MTELRSQPVRNVAQAMAIAPEALGIVWIDTLRDLSDFMVASGTVVSGV